jgi:hypothetical protein
MQNSEGGAAAACRYVDRILNGETCYTESAILSLG